MAPKILKEIVNSMIHLGSLPEKHDLGWARSEFAKLEHHKYLSSKSQQDFWDDVFTQLTTKEHIALLKTVVMATLYAQWEKGLDSLGVFAFKRLEKKISASYATEIALWVIKYSDDPWMPYGNLEKRKSLESLAEARKLELELYRKQRRVAHI